MFVADALAAGLAARSAVKSTGSGMSSPSQYPLINSDQRFPAGQKSFRAILVRQNATSSAPNSPVK
jgi:hypothetical protein